MRTLRVCSQLSCVSYSGVSYRYHVVHYIPSTYLLCNWRFVPFNYLPSSCSPPPCSSSGNHKSDLFSYVFVVVSMFCVFFLDTISKWDYPVFVFLWLVCLQGQFMSQMVGIPRKLYSWNASFEIWTLPVSKVPVFPPKMFVQFLKKQLHLCQVGICFLISLLI